MIEPYYQDAYVTLYHADSLEHPELWAGADVLVTDPPYGISYTSGWARTPLTKSLIAGDESTSTRDAALDMWGDKPALVFGTWRVSRPAGVRERLIWSKAPRVGMGDLSIPWGRSDEEIYVLGRGFVGKRISNVLTYDIVPNSWRPQHPTPKPVDLMEGLIGKITNGSVIADPFAGSGATLVAARNLGRICVGVEIDEAYCEVAAGQLARPIIEGLDLV